MHLYFYSRCNANDMGKIYVEIQVGQVTPACPFMGRTCISVCNQPTRQTQPCVTQLLAAFRRRVVGRSHFINSIMTQVTCYKQFFCIM